jgi:2-C-methyl-D-erythritol 4-phosphate cytidylyltransferase
MSSFAVILPAAGKSSRFADKEKKPFTNLDGRAVWLRSAEIFVTRQDVCQCLIVIAPEDEEVFRRRYTANLAFMDIRIVLGGAERFESVANALKEIKPESEFIAIHDAVRPCLTTALVDTVFSQAKSSGAAILAVPVSDTIKQVSNKKQIQATMPRDNLWLAQTPQVFRKDWLVQAYAQRHQLGTHITDDAQLIEAAGHPVAVVQSNASNIKITTKADIHLAEAILKSQPKPKPTGPAHPFAEEEMWGGRGN